MKTLQKTIVFVTMIFLFSSCQSNTNDVLSNKEMRKGIMDTIANNHEMSMEMMNAMMKSNHGRMMIQQNPEMMMMMAENKDAMIKMMKENPAMMQNMLTGMIDAAKGDTAMISVMINSMQGNQQIKDMMQKMMGDGSRMNMMKDDKKMEGMDNMNGMGNKK